MLFNQIQILFIFIHVTDSSPHFLITTVLRRLHQFVGVAKLLVTFDLILDLDKLAKRFRPVKYLLEITILKSAIFSLF